MTAQAADNSWMLELVTKVRGVRHVVVLSADGIPTVYDDHTSRDVADKLAAACAGFTSLAQGVSNEFGNGPAHRQVMVEFDGGFLFIRGAGEGSRLAAVTDPAIDPGLLAQQMQAQVLVLGERTLSTPRRDG